MVLYIIREFLTSSIATNKIDVARRFYPLLLKRIKRTFEAERAKIYLPQRPLFTTLVKC